jgi:hypothetical protein
VETQGGKTCGRQKQRYILLRRSSTYVIAHHPSVTIFAVQLHCKDRTVTHLPNFTTVSDQSLVQILADVRDRHTHAVAKQNTDASGVRLPMDLQTLLLAQSQQPLGSQTQHPLQPDAHPMVWPGPNAHSHSEVVTAARLQSEVAIHLQAEAGQHGPQNALLLLAKVSSS